VKPKQRLNLQQTEGDVDVIGDMQRHLVGIEDQERGGRS
jgi:hypothetical protein